MKMIVDFHNSTTLFCVPSVTLPVMSCKNYVEGSARRQRLSAASAFTTWREWKNGGGVGVDRVAAP